MAKKQGIFSRISQLTKANVNAMIDKAEDPAKMIDQLIRDYTNEIAEAEAAIAQTIGNVRLAEKDHQANLDQAQEWGNKALAASTKADVARAAGDTAEADRWDGLAKTAIGKQITFEEAARAAEPSIAAQNETVDQLKLGLEQMKEKLAELKLRRDQLVARQRTAEAQAKVTDAMSNINIMDPTSELGRFEEKVRRSEAMAEGRAELAASSLEDQFAELKADAAQIEIEQRLAQLKAQQDS